MVYMNYWLRIWEFNGGTIIAGIWVKVHEGLVSGKDQNKTGCDYM